VIAAYWAGAVTRDMGFKGTVTVNAASGAVTNYLDGKNPFLYGTIAALVVLSVMVLAIKYSRAQVDEFFNPTWKTLNWMTSAWISRPTTLSPIPSIFVNIW
jgi:filamentous hemagglutinin